jgi:hypothetical protein
MLVILSEREAKEESDEKAASIVDGVDDPFASSIVTVALGANIALCSIKVFAFADWM